MCVEGMMAAGGGLGPYTSLRLYVTKTAGASSQVIIRELDFLVGPAGGPYTAYPTSNLTSNSAPSPLSASASSVEVAATEYKAFDGDTGTAWVSANASNGSGVFASPEYIRVNLGTGNGITPTAVRITPGAATAAPADFQVQGSNDPASGVWETIASFSGYTSGWTSGVDRDFAF